jgi:DNA repair exonuclease SbcCD nuclease subunit
MAVLVHTSDVHVDDAGDDSYHSGNRGLRAVLLTAADLNADLVLLAGDTFDNPRVSLPVLQATAALLEAADRPVVMLPGNHDPLLERCIFRRSGIADIPHVRIFGIDADEVMTFESLDLEISGKPHRSFDNMVPFHPPRPRGARFHVVMAHGHYVPPEDWADQSHRSWLISNEALAETAADYVALGHWDRPTPAGAGPVAAYYSGSPKLAKTVNVVRLGNRVEVERVELRWA